MIIVEGPDGAGKTTLVNMLSREFGFKPGERGTRDRSLLYTVTRRDTYTALGEAVKGTNPVRIWDRLFYSELVYADIVGRRVEFTDTEQAYVRRMLEALRCPIIVCLPKSFTTVRNNAARVQQMDGVNSNLRDIYGDYVRMVAEVFPEHTMVYDYEFAGDVSYVQDFDAGFGSYQFSMVTLHDIRREIEDYLDERSERTWC